MEKITLPLFERTFVVCTIDEKWNTLRNDSSVDANGFSVICRARKVKPAMTDETIR